MEKKKKIQYNGIMTLIMPQEQTIGEAIKENWKLQQIT